MIHQTHTRETARKAIIEAIEAGGAAKAREYDVDAVLDRVYSLRDDYDVDALGHDLFWQTIAFCALNNEGA